MISLRRKRGRMDVAIFANGEFNYLNVLDRFLNLDDVFIIGVDGGCDFLIKNNIKIDLAIGDFDSINNKNFIEKISNIKKNNMDYSDLEVAINYCINEKFNNVYMFGCTGKRSDHFMFNLRLLYKIFKNNLNGFIIDEFNVIKILMGKGSFYKENFEFFSILPIYDETVVSINGSEYDLNNKKLNMESTLTLSNKWKNDKVNICVDKPVFIYLVF